MHDLQRPAEFVIFDRDPMQLGESPVWDDERKIVYTIDIEGRSLRITDWETGAQRRSDYAQQIGCIALTQDGRLLLAMEDGIYLRGEDGTLSLFARPEKMAGRRFNDGKIGPDGRFYVGTIGAEHTGALYRVEKDGTVTTLLEAVGCSNGIAWSPDCRTMYYCDSSDRKIEAFRFDCETGTISDRRTVLEFPLQSGTFDGMTVDTEGMLYCAMWQGSAVLKIDPIQRKAVDKFCFPARRISCPAFAGPGLDCLIVTSAADPDGEDGPYGGCTFLCRCGAKGAAPLRLRLR